LSVFKSFGIYTISGFLNKGISFLFLPILTAYLNPADYGAVTLFSNSILFLTPFISLSVSTSISTDYFKYNKAEFSTYFSSVILLPLIVTSLCLIILIPFGAWIATNVGIEIQYLFLIPILAVSGLFFEILLSILRNKNQAYLFAILTLVKTVIELGISSLFIIGLGMKWQGRILGWLIISVFTVGYAFYYFRKNGFLTPDIDTKYLPAELKYSVPMIVNQFAIFMVISSDKFFIAKYLSTEEVGIYGVASQIACISFAFSGAIILSFNPFLYEALKNYTPQKKIEVRNKLMKFIGLMFLLCVTIAAITPIIYHFFINIKYHSGQQYVKWILCAYFFWFIYWLLLGFTYFYKLKKLILFTSIFSTILSLTLIFLMVQQYGTIGAVCALNISCFLAALLLFLTIKFRFKLI
jgi:O-antigen/teichoic acid export membrane protein